MAYKIDLHCHSWFSADGVSSPEAMVASARRKGVHGLALTDHNTCEGYFDLVDRGLARTDGQPVDGFLVIPGVEMSTAEGHLLCLGVTLPNLKGAPAAEVCRRVHALGGLAIPAHPYDPLRAGIREAVLETLEIDALEVFNAATTFKSCNQRALQYAQRRQLPMTAGSDAHHQAAVATAYTLLPTHDFSVRGILEQISRGTEREEKYLTTADALRKTMNNWFRLRKKRVRLGGGAGSRGEG
jgi:predicted metal-dependent phosphoesterase TrpH